MFTTRPRYYQSRQYILYSCYVQIEYTVLARDGKCQTATLNHFLRGLPTFLARVDGESVAADVLLDDLRSA